MRCARERVRQGFSERETHFIERGTDWDAITASVQQPLAVLRAPHHRDPARERQARRRRRRGARSNSCSSDDADYLVLIIAPRLDRDAQSAAWVKAVEQRRRLGYRSGRWKTSAARRLAARALPAAPPQGGR